MGAVPSLRDLQRRFMTALYDADAPGPLAAIAGNGLTAAARLRIYRNSCRESQVAALRVTYPAVRALVGDAFFDQTAHGFRHAHPSRSGNLQAFGAQLGDYLATLASCRAYPYLPDVARLEWLRQETILAPGASAIAEGACIESLRTAAETVHATLHPSLHLANSRYPILRLWRYAMQPSPEPPTLGDGECVVLWREDGEVAMGAVDPATFACIAAMRRGSTLDAARRAATAIDSDFDLSMCVQTLLDRGLITDLRATAGGAGFIQPGSES